MIEGTTEPNHEYALGSHINGVMDFSSISRYMFGVVS